MRIATNEIYPIIVPGEYASTKAWDLPHYKFDDSEYILTWVFMGNQGGMDYITRDNYKFLEDKHPGWQQKAFDNLRMSIDGNESFFTQYKMSKDGRLLFLGFLNADGIGSSRILFSRELTKAFPTGYYVAFPDRSCGLVIAKNIQPVELADIEKMVQKMHNDATIAMSGKLSSPDNFKLPEEWIKPGNPELTDIMVEEIANLQRK